MTDRHLEPPDPVRDALRALPRERASADFTARVVECIEAPKVVSPRRPGWPRLATAAAAALILSLTAGMLVHDRLQARRELDQRLALEFRHEELRRELAALRRQVADPPTLYLGATSQYDIVLDLGPWLEQGTVRPASYSLPNH